MKPKRETNTASLAVIGVDIGKEVFHLVGLGVDGKIAFRKKIRRLGLKDAFEKLPPWIVGMEACLSAHFVSRVLLGTRATDHPGDLRQAVLEGAEERLQRCRGNRRGGVATEPACRAGKEPRSARPAGVSPRAVPTGLPPDGDDQPDPSLSDRAGDRRPGRPTRPSQLAFRNIGEPKG
jgi:hypothetical protein